MDESRKESDEIFVRMNRDGKWYVIDHPELGNFDSFKEAAVKALKMLGNKVIDDILNT